MILPLLKLPPHSPTFAKAVVDRIIPGFVDMDRNHSDTFLIGTQSGLLYVSGNEESSLVKNRLVELFRTRKREGTRFTLFSPTKKWDDVIQHLLANEISSIQRYAFSYNKPERSKDEGYPVIHSFGEYGGCVGLVNYDNCDEIKYDDNRDEINYDDNHDGLQNRSENNLPPGFILGRITADSIDLSRTLNRAYYEEYWGSVSSFLKNGIGYCVLYENEVVSECTSIFRSAHYAEIDIETSSGFRGQGLGIGAARAFIDECMVKGITPCWDCDVSNEASIKLARKLGFGDPHEYSIFVKHCLTSSVGEQYTDIK
ncbi:GNAT acetyltransferase [compost metagenome]